MKIVKTSNFDLDTYKEVLVANNISDRDNAIVMCQALNKKFSGDNHPDYYKITEDEYELSLGLEGIV